MRQRGAVCTRATRNAYSFRALFEFVLQPLKTAPCALTLEQLDASLVGAFLEQLEMTPRRIGGLEKSSINQALWVRPRRVRRACRVEQPGVSLNA